jgi:hypothetical protein
VIESGSYYYVEGGVFTDTTFTDIVPGTDERYGPFKDYDHALSVWRGKMGWNIDICSHRLFIVTYYLAMDIGEPT